MFSFSSTIYQKIKNGTPPSPDEALRILHCHGSELTSIFAITHALREKHFGATIELCSIINAKSGHCAEDCSFCAQSRHHTTGIPVFPLKSKEEIVRGANQAASNGSRCYGIVTSGTRVKDGEEFIRILDAIREIRSTTSIAPSASLGILNRANASALAEAGCVTYHHNLETARSYFPQVCTTHSYDEDIQTIRVAIDAGMKVCCGGIFGLGESLEQRVELCLTLRELNVDSIPLNFLNPIPGTPLADQHQLTPLDCLRIIALFRIMHPAKRINVCAGRELNLRDLQSWIFMAGASGTMIGNYLTTSGRDQKTDLQMFCDAEVKVDACR